MPTYSRNHALTYRPLIGGIAITAQGVGVPGTLALIAYDHTGPWIISNYHVLCRTDLSPFTDGETVFQPFITAGSTPIARLVTAKASTTLDCAAARVEPGIAVASWILELGAVTHAAQPVVGRRVIKSGLATGITEGVITDVTADKVRIEVQQTFPTRYNLTDIGDSGSCWIDPESRAATVLHNRTQDGSTEAAFGFTIPSVLNALALRLKP